MLCNPRPTSSREGLPNLVASCFAFEPPAEDEDEEVLDELEELEELDEEETLEEDELDPVLLELLDIEEVEELALLLTEELTEEATDEDCEDVLLELDASPSELPDEELQACSVRSRLKPRGRNNGRMRMTGSGIRGRHHCSATLDGQSVGPPRPAPPPSWH